MSVRPRVGIVVPAHDEAPVLAACLWSVLTQSGAPPLSVVVVANGCSDRTAELAEEHRPLAERFGHRLTVIETRQRSKAGALNRGESRLQPGVRVFLDADVVLGPGAVAALVAALDSGVPRLAAPQVSIYDSPSRQVRGFFRVWKELPSVRGQVIGGGIYAVNAAGRRRWNEFPELAADDAFVRTRFALAETRLLASDAFLMVPPSSAAELRRTLRRWRAADRQLPSAVRGASLRERPRTHGRALLGRPSTWPSAPGFLTQQLLSRVRARPAVSARWSHPPRDAESDPACDARTAGSPLHVVVVTHNSESEISSCLHSVLHELPAPLMTVTVVDNDSRDQTVEIVREFDRVELLPQHANLGFGRAANLGASRRPSDSGWILLVNPDARLEPGAIRGLVAIAKRFPRAGIYGAQSRDASGTVDRTACLAAPSLRQALAYAAGAHRVPALRRLDPDALGGWRRDAVRAVPVLTASLLLVDVALWARLDGFDERYLHYGEDVDLCLRARGLRARPMFSHLSRYEHVGGASVSATEREMLILRGKSELYRRHLRYTGGLAVAALEAGVALRALTSAPDGTRDWRRVLAARASWTAGFGAGAPVRPPTGEGAAGVVA